MDDIKDTDHDGGRGGGDGDQVSNNPFDLADEEVEDTPIDDDEFNIPPIDFEPTLESILYNDDDNRSLSDDDGGGNSLLINETQLMSRLGGTGGISNESNADTMSIASRNSDNKSRNSSRSNTTGRNSSNYHGGHYYRSKPNIMKYVLLKGMSQNLISASEKMNSGTSTAICLGASVAVGTSHGFVFVFDSMQVLKYCFGETKFREEGGSVSSLAISPAGNRLIVGYAKGLILMYNLENGKLLRIIQDAHANSTAVLILRFTDNPNLAMCSDSGGSVFELNFKRTMGIRECESRCIFSGSRGEVCTFEPLILSSYPDNPLTKYVIAALATLSKVIVVMIRPKLKVLFTHPLTTHDPSTLPLLAWQMVIIQTSKNDKIVDPVLTFARENLMLFFQMTLDNKNSIQFIPLQRINLNHPLLSIHWLNSRTMALLDTRERLRIYDVRSQEEIEEIDLSQTRLVYASSHFKGIATGGNVSRAFALAGEKSCYNSILCMNSQIVVLGTKCVNALNIRTWSERLDYLVKQFSFLEALNLGYEIFTDKAKAIVGLKGSKDAKRNSVREKMLTILDRFVDRIPALNYMEDLNTAKQNYQEVIPVCVKYYVLLFDINPIFEKLYDICAENPICKSVYLESLEPFILNDQLRAIPPTIVKDFVSYYEELENFKALEASIVHINVESLDIHQIMKICWTQCLYDAIIYVYNQGMNDFISPLEELMTELKNSLSAESKLADSQTLLGNKILVYISCCLSGRAYPYGNIPFNMVEKVQSDIFCCISTLHTKNHTEAEPAYPYLMTLLDFNTREFLNVLNLAFEEHLFQTELGRRQKQRIIDILLQVTVEQGNSTPTRVGILFTFLARQMARPDSSLYVSKLLFEQILEHLTCTSVKELTEEDERQQALLELLQAGGIQHFDPQKLLEKCLKAKFFRVCEMLYERKHEYDKIIDCYIHDEQRNWQIFSYLNKIFRLKPTKHESFEAKVKEFIEDLIQIDNRKTAETIFLYMGSQIPELSNALKSKPEKQYSFLQGIFAHSEENQITTHLDGHLTENYIELMGKYNPAMVNSFLKSNSTYRLDQAMEICKKYKLIEAWGYLLEKDGKILEAFDLMMNQFHEKLNEILGGIQSEQILEASLESSLTWQQLQALFLVIIQFSQRNSSSMLSSEREKLWLPLLELIIGAHNKLHESRGKGLSKYFNEMTKHLLSSMMGHISLPTIVEIIMNDSSYEKATFAETRDLITGMLETCTYEEMMVTLVKRITESDVYDKLRVKAKTTKKGLTCRERFCPVCQMTISNSHLSRFSKPSSLVVFNCGHAYHFSCCQQTNLTYCSKCRVQFDPASTSASFKQSDTNAKILQDNHTLNTVLRTRNRTISSESRTSDDEYRDSQLLTHSEFELKCEAPTKVKQNKF